LQFEIGDECLKTLEKMKVRGVTMDNRLSWSLHINATINKLCRLTSALKLLRNRLSKPQFLQVLTSQYYVACYYGCQSWLGWHTRKMDICKLNSLHYRLLRIAERDWKTEINREQLDKLGRARPTTWAKYSPQT
jgi:hypothetical protein